VEQCIAFALNSELSLSNGNDKNVLLNNVSTMFTGDIILFWWCGNFIIDMILQFFFISDFPKVQINTEDFRCMG
jgi:hypothetical protein